VHRLIIRHCFSTLTFNGITEQLFNVYSGGYYSLFIRFYCSHGDDSMKNTIKPDNYIIENELQHTNYFICIRITCGKPMYDCINLPTMKVNTVTFQKLKYKCQARRVRVHVFVC
jgi:ribonucleotide reductase beta subunit family protein with ferritin-like domain